jgi:hypothetical protein
VPDGERKRHAEQVDRVLGVVDSVIRGADADLYNWADEAIKMVAMQAVHAFGKLTAELASRLAAATGLPIDDVLREAREAALPR